MLLSRIFCKFVFDKTYYKPNPKIHETNPTISDRVPHGRRRIPGRGAAVTGKRGSDDFQIGVAGYTYRNFTIDQTLEYLRSLGVKYLSIKDFWLPLDATAEEMHEFKAKCSQYGVEGCILGPIYMNSEAEVDRAFAYAERYGSDHVHRRAQI